MTTHLIKRTDVFIIPKGSVISISNPDYDELDLSTHENIDVLVTDDMVVYSADDYQVEQIEFVF